MIDLLKQRQVEVSFLADCADPAGHPPLRFYVGQAVRVGPKEYKAAGKLEPGDIVEMRGGLHTIKSVEGFCSVCGIVRDYPHARCQEVQS